jgi:transposase-like protein
MATEPKTLQEAILYFASPANCREYLIARRWQDGVTCPRCGSKAVSFLQKYNRWQCAVHHEQRQFTLKTGTIMEDSPIGLDKWLMVMWMLSNCKNGVSSYEIHRDIKVTQKTAWFMLQRIRLALQDGATVKLGGEGSEVEVDETYIGGRARNMHENVKKRRGIGGGGFSGKVAVQGLLDRGGDVRARVLGVGSASHETLRKGVREHVEEGTTVYTDEAKAYRELARDFDHQFVQHAEKYVDGKIHTNGMENFWSLLKRGINGTYVSVEPFHLFRYVDEQAFRYNNRATKKNPLDDSDRFDLVVRQIVGKRLTWDALTGKVGSSPVN